jgi:hypothetical protein
MAGTLARSMPIRPPGMFLSQPPTTSTPSIHWPCTQVSMQSAITSRLTSEYFMPSVPMAMPSDGGRAEDLRVAAGFLDAGIAASASFCRPLLQGVMVLWPLATPTIGFLKSVSL